MVYYRSTLNTLNAGGLYRKSLYSKSSDNESFVLEAKLKTT